MLTSSNAVDPNTDAAQVGLGFVYGIKAAAAAAVGVIIIITHPEKTDSSGMIRQMMQLLRSQRREEGGREARNAGAKKVAKLTPKEEGEEADCMRIVRP